MQSIQNISLISNLGETRHREHIAEAMSWAEEIVLCAAYWREGCIVLFRNDLQKAIESGKKIEMFVSLYDEITEAEALIELLGMDQRNPNVSLFICSKGDNIFHSKIYYFTKGDQFRAIIGSANFTQAAMNDNDEVSVKIEGFKTDLFHTQLISYLSSLCDGKKKRGKTEVTHATSELINNYIPKYNKRRRKKVPLL